MLQHFKLNSGFNSKIRVFSITLLAFFLSSCCLCPDPDNKAERKQDQAHLVINLNDLASLYKSLDTKPLPSFSCISNVKDKKALFFGFILDFVRDHNHQVLLTRDNLKQLKEKWRLQAQTLKSDSSENNDPTLRFTQEEQIWLSKLAKMHRSPMPNDAKSFDQLLTKVDIIPPSMALAQAANESAWGTSRFALQANNLFGQWCFKPGCGVVPNQRPEGATYEVKLFKTPSESVGQYMLNINRNASYDKVRSLRAAQRDNQKIISGSVIAGGLEKYSARGEAYIEELRSMIEYNRLSQWDNAEAKYQDLSLIKQPGC